MLAGTPAVWVGNDKPPKRVVSIHENIVTSTKDQQGPKVLVVDDEILIADTVVTILKQNGFRAYAAYDGRQGLEMAKEISPDYLLSDVLMPKMNGVEVAIALRDMKLPTKIFLFSGQSGISGLLAEAEKKGHEFEVIRKPIRPERLVEILKKR